MFTQHTTRSNTWISHTHRSSPYLIHLDDHWFGLLTSLAASLWPSSSPCTQIGSLVSLISSCFQFLRYFICKDIENKIKIIIKNLRSVAISTRHLLFCIMPLTCSWNQYKQCPNSLHIIFTILIHFFPICSVILYNCAQSFLSPWIANL